MSGKPETTTFNAADASNQLAIVQSYLISIYPYLYNAGIKPVSYNHVIELFKQNNTAIMNKLTYVKGAFDFTDLTPSQMSQLVPQVRIYKQLYEDGVPTEEIEFVVPDKTDTDILLNDTTDQGLGIKNFQYKYVGSNPATVRNDIEAKLTLYFQNFSELLRVRRSKTASGEKEYSFLDLFSRARKQQQITGPSVPAFPTIQPISRASYQTTTTIVNGEEQVTLTGDAKDYEGIVGRLDTQPDRNEYLGPIEFEVKVVVGWAVPRGNTTLSAQQIEAIENSSQAFFLTLIDHDFSFEQDGTFSVELNYRARLGAIMDSPQLDILRIDTLTDSQAEAQTWLDDAGLANIFEGSVADIVRTVQEDIKNARYSCEPEVAQKLQDRLDRLEANIRGERYSKIAKHFIDKKLFYAEEIDNGTLNSWANARIVGIGGRLPDYGDASDFDKSYRGGIDEQDPTAVSESDIESTLSMLAEYDELTRTEFAHAITTENPTTGLNAGGTVQQQAAGRIVNYFTDPGAQIDQTIEAEFREERWKKVVETPLTTSPTDYNLNQQSVNKFTYFLFGDLLDYVIEEAKKPSDGSEGITQQDLQRIKVLVGSCDLGIPGDPIYPITHIPISWLAFRNFFYKKVIRPKREKYPLLQFIRDMIRDLLFGSINSVYYNGGTKKFNNSFKSSFVSLPSKQGNDPIAMASQQQGGGGVKIDISQFTIQDPLAFMSARAKSSDMYHYMCIFVEDGKKRQFARKEMLRSGHTSRRSYNREILNIHHFGFGEDRGILKSANFAKTDQPYLRESRYLEKGGDPLVQLSNVYEASVTLFGAPFFYPGQYIWITPYGLSKSKNQSFRLGSPDAGPITTGLPPLPPTTKPGSIANIMGLGGYHIIIDVQGIIEDGLYEVKLNARFDNSGADAGDREGYGSKEVRRCEDDEGPNVNP